MLAHDGPVAGLHLAPPLHDLLGVRRPTRARAARAWRCSRPWRCTAVLGALADFLGVGEHPVDEVAELGAAHRRPAAVGGGDALAAGARPARHELVALVAVGEHDGAGLGDDALAVDHAEADGAADAVAVLEQVDDLDAVLDAHAELARVLGHVEREVLVEHGQAPRVLRQPAHVLGLAGVVAVDVHAPALEPLEVGPRLAGRSPAGSPGPRGSRRRCARGSRGRCRARRRVHEDDVAAALVGLAAPAGDDLVDDEHVDLGVGLLGGDRAGEAGDAAADDQQVGGEDGAEVLEGRHLTPPPASRCRRSR